MVAKTVLDTVFAQGVSVWHTCLTIGQVRPGDTGVTCTGGTPVCCVGDFFFLRRRANPFKPASLIMLLGRTYVFSRSSSSSGSGTCFACAIMSIGPWCQVAFGRFFGHQLSKMNQGPVSHMKSKDTEKDGIWFRKHPNAALM
jgi:hypothetical protein